MSIRVRFEQARRWREALRPDADLAAAEGMAAGLGLLTGDVARQTTSPHVPTDVPDCATCGGRNEVAVVDLVGRSTTLRCRACGRRTTTDLTAEVAPPR